MPDLTWPWASCGIYGRPDRAQYPRGVRVPVFRIMIESAPPCRHSWCSWSGWSAMASMVLPVWARWRVGGEERRRAGGQSAGAGLSIWREWPGRRPLECAPNDLDRRVAVPAMQRALPGRCCRSPRRNLHPGGYPFDGLTTWRLTQDLSANRGSSQRVRRRCDTLCQQPVSCPRAPRLG